jgi:nicotinate-nucleotide adenylyltransferase
LSVAALLHDITKEQKIENQILLCKRFAIPVSDEDRLSPKTFHAKTGACFAREEFPSLTDDTVFGCIRWHTTGRAAMTLPEKLLYLADYIENTRDFPDCIELRRYFYSGIDTSDKFNFLDKTLVLSFDMTIRNLLDEGGIINTDTVNSRNYLLTGASK